MSVLPLIQDVNLLAHLSSLLATCWPSGDNQQENSPGVSQKLRGSSKVTKAALNLLAAILDKLLNGKIE